MEEEEEEEKEEDEETTALREKNRGEAERLYEEEGSFLEDQHVARLTGHCSGPPLKSAPDHLIAAKRLKIQVQMHQRRTENLITQKPQREAVGNACRHFVETACEFPETLERLSGDEYLRRDRTTRGDELTLWRER